jgi:hypothetical protein
MFSLRQRSKENTKEKIEDKSKLTYYSDLTQKDGGFGRMNTVNG